jgi:hypothetical protein
LLFSTVLLLWTVVDPRDDAHRLRACGARPDETCSGMMNDPSMSQMGQSRRFCDVRDMSAWEHFADPSRTSRQVREGHFRTLATLTTSSDSEPRGGNILFGSSNCAASEQTEGTCEQKRNSYEHAFLPQSKLFRLLPPASYCGFGCETLNSISSRHPPLRSASFPRYSHYLVALFAQSWRSLV